MDLDFRFGIVSDLHIALPETISTNPKRFHLVEISIPALECALERLSQLDLDFLLIPGDLTQDGEIVNHLWLKRRLAQLPFPVYVVPGNHDLIQREGTEQIIGVADFPHYYHQFGYRDRDRCYYQQEILPGVQLIGLNSQQFDREGKQQGYIDEEQLNWLEAVLARSRDDLNLVMVHHNVIEHIPDQSVHSLGRRYMIDNAAQLRSILHRYGVKLIFTGHLHIQDIAEHNGAYDITTGSLIGYPHPYRICHYHQQGDKKWLQIESGYVKSLPNWEKLPQTTRQWIGDRSSPFMLKLLTEPPLNFCPQAAQELIPYLRHFWADIAAGDALFEFTDFPPTARRYFESFSAKREGTPMLIDNHAVFFL
jgi:3',5'-cyclic AMP phosphodiesterase CpdA